MDRVVTGRATNARRLLQHSLTRVARLAVLLVLVALCVSSAGCSKLKALAGKKTNIEVTKVALSADPLTAAREIGAAAATAKDEAKLAGMLLALLERLDVAVVSTDGKKMLVPGPLSDPPKEIFFWEPMLAGLGRATAKGDTRLMSTFAKAYWPSGNADALAEVDFTTMFAELAKQATAEKATTNDAILVVAIAEDLAKRGATSHDPRIDPVGGALFGLWMSMAQTDAPSAPAIPGLPSGIPGLPTNIPGLPSGIPGLPPGLQGLPGMPPVKNDLSRAVRNQAAGGSGGGCEFFNDVKDKVGKGAGLFGKVGKYVPGRFGQMASAFDDFMKGASELKDAAAGKAAQLAENITAGIAGSAIAAFIEVDGDVKPTKVKYGDGPVKYEVKVDSKNPFSEEQLKKLVSCLKASTPGFSEIWEPLDDIPPPGPAEGIPVAWLGWKRYDPRHGTFTVDPGRGSPPKGMIDQLKKAAQDGGRNVAADAKVSITDSDGKAKATFQVKDKKVEKVTTVTRSYLVFANVFPFPISKNPVFVASNLLYSREVPLRLEIEAPFPKNWLLTYTYSTMTSGGGIAGGWKMKMEGTVPFTLDPSDPKMRFSAKGTGTWQVSFDGSMGGVMQCEAPAGAQPLDIEITGAVTNAETFSTDFTMDVQGRGKVAANLRCKALGGIKVDVPLSGPVDGRNAAAGNGFDRFTMNIDEGAMRMFPQMKSAGGAATSGYAKVVLTPRD